MSSGSRRRRRRRNPIRAQVAPSQLTPPSPLHGVDSAERSEDLHVRMFEAGANQAPILFNVVSHRALGHRQQQGREPDGTNLER
ncbi:polymeric immunoglobulin receptor [Sarotherodon galilaeus]